jgi:hypothetical protein
MFFENLKVISLLFMQGLISVRDKYLAPALSGCLPWHWILNPGSKQDTQDLKDKPHINFGSISNPFLKHPGYPGHHLPR